MKKLSQIPAYILHYRPYRETSLLLDVLTAEGRLGIIARGVRTSRSKTRGLLQPFVPLLISCVGRGELMTMQQVDPNGSPIALTGRSLVCGLYVNELLVRLLHRDESLPEVFSLYEKVLKGLLSTQYQAKVLRFFERDLLAKLGYALPLIYEVNTGDAIEAENYYLYDASHGFFLMQQPRLAQNVFSGDSLLSFHADDLSSKQALQDARRLTKLALQTLLGNKILKSGELLC